MTMSTKLPAYVVMKMFRNSVLPYLKRPFNGFRPARKNVQIQFLIFVLLNLFQIRVAVVDYVPIKNVIDRINEFSLTLKSFSQ